MRFTGMTVAFNGDPQHAELLKELGTVDLLSSWRTAAPGVRRRWKVAAAGVETFEGVEELELSSPVITQFGGAYTLIEKLIRDRRFTRSYAVYFNPAVPGVQGLDDLEYAAHRLAEAGLVAAELLEGEVNSSLKQLAPDLEVLLVRAELLGGKTIEELKAGARQVGEFLAASNCSVFVSGVQGDPEVCLSVVSTILTTAQKEDDDASNAGTGEAPVDDHADS